MNAHHHSHHPHPHRPKNLLYWLIGLGSLLWLALRSGTDPRRLAYPCQRAALATSAGLAVYVLSGLGVTQLYRRLRQRPALSTLGLFLLMLMIASVLSGSITPPYLSRAASPSLPAWTSASAGSNVFAVTNVPVPGCSLRNGVLPITPPCNTLANALRDQGVDALISLMDNNGTYFYKTTAHPNGIVGKSDVVVIKVNNQWGGEGDGAGMGRMATNTDVLKGLIWKVLQHPDDFTGEVVVAENGQWWPKSWDVTLANAQDQYQSIQDVVSTFQSLGYAVSLFDWSDLNASRINGGSITNPGYPAGEYISGNNSNAYILLEDPAGGGTNELSYPKFQTANGNRVSMRYGVWNGSSYNSDQLTFINLPVLKKHGMAGATIAWKNLIGFVTAEPIGSTDRYGDWNAMHDFYWGYTGDANRNYGLLGREIALVRAPDLNLVDAIWVAYETNTGGQAIRQDVLLASTDPFAVDWYSSEYVLRPVASNPQNDSSAARGGTFRDATRVNQNAAASVWPGGSANYPYIDLLDGYDGSTPTNTEKNQMNAYVMDMAAAAAPDLTFDPAALGVGVETNSTATRVLTLSNTGSADLTWNLAENPARSWLNESSTSGTIAPSDSTLVTLTFDTTGLSRGAYTITLQITGNAPAANIPVTLIVDPYRVYLPLIQK